MPVSVAAAAALLCPAGAMRAQGTWSELRRAHLPASVSWGGLLADLDLDGDLDYVQSSPYGVGVLVNDGAARFQTQTPPMQPPVSGVLAGDLDADGDADVVSDSCVWINNAGTLAQVTVNLGFVYACVDFTGDGRADVFSATGIWRSIGGGAFASMPTPPRPARHCAAAADFDGDGDMDVLFGVSPLWTPVFEQVWRNDGLGNFTDVSSLWWPNPDNDDTVLVLTGDVDGDGDVDSVHTDGAGTWKLRRNDGSGVLQPWAVFSDGTDLSRRFADLDGDGDLDLAGISDWLRNDGAGVFARILLRRRPAANIQFSLHAVGDVNGDGKPDLIGNEGAEPRLWLNRLPLSFVAAAGNAGIPITDLQLGDGQSVVVGDCDRDGDADFVRLVGPLYRNDGSGWIEPRDHGWAATFSPALFADVDGDGDEDVVGHEPGPLLVVQRNAGNGTWTPGPAMAIPGQVLLAFDADGDGDRDLLLPAVRLLRNDGTGSFALDAATPAGTLPCTRAAVADFDGDGDRDVLAGDLQLHMFVNDGTGAFTWMPSRLGVIPGQLSLSCILPFDADGDGDIDVFATQEGSGHRMLLLRNVGGVLVDTNGLLPAFGGPLAAAGDVDGDGDVDLAVAPGSQLFGIRDWRNDGTGLMTEVGSIPIGSFPDRPALVDVDGDGDLDVVRGNSIFRNRHWHAAAQFVPVRGHDYIVEFGGTAMPNCVAAPMLGARARWPLPPFGTVGIDVTSAVPLPLATVTNGTGTLSIPVPSNAALLGQQFGVQAVLMDGIGFHLTPVVYDTVF
jgi:hypothetical protein